MFKPLIDWAIEIVNKFGLWGVFFASIIEEVIAPIPSPIVMMSAGAAMLSEYNSPSTGLAVEMLLIAIVGALGATIGSYLPFFIAYYGGKPLIEKTSKFTGVSWKFIEKLQARLEKSNSDEITIGSLRAIPVMPSVLIAVTCGLMRINIFSYSISFFIGGIIRGLVFLIVGWQLGAAYVDGAHAFEDVSDWVQAILLVGIIIGLGYLYWKRNRIEKDIEEEKN